MRKIQADCNGVYVVSPECPESMTDRFTINSTGVKGFYTTDNIVTVTIKTSVINDLIEALIDFRGQLSLEMAMLENDAEK